MDVSVTDATGFFIQPVAVASRVFATTGTLLPVNTRFVDIGLTSGQAVAIKTVADHAAV